MRSPQALGLDEAVGLASAEQAKEDAEPGPQQRLPRRPEYGTAQARPLAGLKPCISLMRRFPTPSILSTLNLNWSCSAGGRLHGSAHAGLLRGSFHSPAGAARAAAFIPARQPARLWRRARHSHLGCSTGEPLLLLGPRGIIL